MEILTDAEIAEICVEVACVTPCDIAYARAIEAAVLAKLELEKIQCYNKLNCA